MRRLVFGIFLAFFLLPPVYAETLQAVAIKPLIDGWGYTYSFPAPYIGTGAVRFLPITEEAEKVFRSLDRNATYVCDIEYFTFMKVNSTDTDYYVRQITCR